MADIKEKCDLLELGTGVIRELKNHDDKEHSCIDAFLHLKLDLDTKIPIRRDDGGKMVYEPLRYIMAMDLNVVKFATKWGLIKKDDMDFMRAALFHINIDLILWLCDNMDMAKIVEWRRPSGATFLHLLMVETNIVESNMDKTIELLDKFKMAKFDFNAQLKRCQDWGLESLLDMAIEMGNERLIRYFCSVGCTFHYLTYKDDIHFDQTYKCFDQTPVGLQLKIDNMKFLAELDPRLDLQSEISEHKLMITHLITQDPLLNVIVRNYTPVFVEDEGGKTFRTILADDAKHQKCLNLTGLCVDLGYDFNKMRPYIDRILGRQYPEFHEEYNKLLS